MRAIGIAFIAAAVGCSDESTPVTPMPDACPLPSAPPECMPDGFATVNPDGTWHMVGTTTTKIEQGEPTTSAIDQVVTIQRTACAADLSFEHPNAEQRVDNTVIESRCEPGRCIRTTSFSYVCVRATDGALIYWLQASHTSTMPGNTYSTSTSMAVLTRVP